MGHKHISRRRFLGEASCAALGTTTFLSSMLNLNVLNALAVPEETATDDYKALVCILLAGGNDSYNMLVPRGTSEHAEYAATRADLALAQSSLLPLNPLNSIGKELGLHPSMSGLQTLFESGKAAMISNIGTLIEPIANRSEYRSGLKKLPLGLYSHSDQIQQWQTSVPQDRSALGWAGRMADILMEQNDNQNISMNISLSGRNVFQSGQTTFEYTIANDGNGAEGIEAISTSKSNSGFLNRLRDNAIESLMEDVYSNIFQSTLSNITEDSLDAQKEFAAAIGAVPPFNTQFSEHYLSQNLQMVAKVIAARQDLKMKRQTFFMTFGGWDHHNEVIENQQYMLGVVSNAIKEFHDALGEIAPDMLDKVTTFTISDFGRTWTSNGQGSDHAWGGNHIMMGGAVNGQNIYGQYPDMYLNNNPLNLSDRGVIIPTTSTDEYFAELALWFGVPSNDLSMVLPNIGNFYAPGSPNPPIGFLNV